MNTDLGFIHRFVPATAVSSPVTLLMLHGTGGDEQDLIPLGRTLLPGAAIVSPRGNVLEHGMPRFFRRVAEGVFDIDDLKFRTHELAQFIGAARREYELGGQIFAVGYSNGANIATSMMFLHPGALAGAVLFRAMVPFVPDNAPDLRGTGVLLAAARHDQIVPVAETMKVSELLQTAGADVTLHWHGGGHELGNDDIETARQWLAAR
jgi:predicted esterase